jgi:hypothetical protein
MHTVIRVISRARIVNLIALIAVALVMLACAAATVGEVPKVPTTGPGGAPPIKGSPPRVHTVSSTTMFPAASVRTTRSVSVECPANEARLGGGYDLAQEPRGSSANVLGSAPSTNGWGVTFDHFGKPVVATLYAQCLRQPEGAVTLVAEGIVVPSQVEIKGTARCPSGTTLVGGGYLKYAGIILDAIGPTTDSALPGWSATVWNLSAAPGHLQAIVFATCYAHEQTTQEGTNTSPGTLSTHDGFSQIEFDTACPLGTYVTAGGFSASPSATPYQYTSAPNEVSSAWHTIFKDGVFTDLDPKVWCVAF